MRKSALAIAISIIPALVVTILGCAQSATVVENPQTAMAARTPAVARVMTSPTATDELTRNLGMLDDVRREARVAIDQITTGGKLVPDDLSSAWQQIEDARQSLQRLDQGRAEVMIAVEPSELPAELQIVDEAIQTALANMASIEEAWQALQRLDQERAEVMIAVDASELPAELQIMDKAREDVLANMFGGSAGI